MTFAHPLLLWVALAAVPALGIFFWWSWRKRLRLIAAFVPKRLQASLTLGHSPRRTQARAALLIAAVVFLLLGLARPRLGASMVEVSQRGLDILIGIDTSKSMLAEDAGPGISRLRRAKLAALDLARLARTDRVGLIAFAGSAFLQCPLTVDDDAFRQSVDALDADIIPAGGTSLGPAIRTALEAHATDSQNVRVLILFSDGEEHETGALSEAEAAKEADLRVFTVGVGTARGEIIRVRDEQGNPGYLKDAQGNVVKSALNEALLRDVAERTGGFYLPLQGARVMEELFHRGLEPLPRADLKARQIEQFDERFQIPLLFALLLLAIESVLPERARPKGNVREAPLAHPAIAPMAHTPSRASVLLLITAAALGLFSPRPTSASPESALRAYEEGRFDEALREYERLARNAPADARLQFNAGAAAFRAEDYERASRHFSNTLRTPDLQLQRDAYYNLGNSLYARGESVQDAKARRPLWESAAQNLESALHLAPNHPETQHNLEFVRRRLQELEQQQQQQDQKQDQKQDPNDSDQKEDQSAQDKASQDPSSESNPDAGDSRDEQKSDGAQDPQQSKDRQDQKDSPESDSQEPKESPPKDAPGSDGDDQGRQGATPQDQSGGQQGQEDASAGNAATEAPAGQMSPQQALRLLDSARGEERPVPLEKKRARSRSIKDW